VNLAGVERRIARPAKPAAAAIGTPFTSREEGRGLAFRVRDGQVMALEMCRSCRRWTERDDHRLGYGGADEAGRGLCHACFSIGARKEVKDVDRVFERLCVNSGCSPSVIAGRLGLKAPLVTQCLKQLALDGRAERRGELWFAVANQ